VLQDSRNVIPATLALLLHVIVFGSLVVVLDFGDRARPVIPLAITGTLVTDNAIVIPPEPEPVPDTSEQDRLRLEEQKRLEDARIEEERLNRIKQLEDRNRAEAAAERKRIADAETERKRLEADRAREAEVERQRQENERERERLQADAATARQEELDAETSRLQAMQADAKAAYAFRIRQRVMSRWSQPATATLGIECIVNIKQLPGGVVVDVSIGRCNGDAAVQRSIVAAVNNASPLPPPADPSVFERDIQIEFRPTAE